MIVVDGWAMTATKVPGSSHQILFAVPASISQGGKKSGSTTPCVGSGNILVLTPGGVLFFQVLVFLTGPPTCFLDAGEAAVTGKKCLLRSIEISISPILLNDMPPLVIVDDAHPVVAIAAERILHYKTLSQSCRERSIAVDIFCLGLAGKAVVEIMQV